MERRTVGCGKFTEMMEALGTGARRDGGAATPKEAAAGRPQPLEANVLVQAHATHLADCAAERPDRDAELAGEIGGIDRRGRAGCDVVVDPLHELDRALAVDRGAQIRHRIDPKQIVEREQQTFLEMGGHLAGFEQERLHGRGSQDVEQGSPRVEQGGPVRDAGPQVVGVIEPAPVSQLGGEDDHGMMIGLRLDEMAFIVAAERNEEARIEIQALEVDLEVVGHRQDYHSARHPIGGVEDARKRPHHDDAACRQGDHGAGRCEVWDVERNASGVLHRLDRSKRIDVGKADQLERGGWSEGVEQHGWVWPAAEM